MLPGKNHPFIEDKQREHDKEIKRDHKVFSHFVNGSLLESLLGFSHDVLAF
jgi:hypothetical protein